MSFSAQGKKWVDDVRVCLMSKLYPIIAHPMLTCSKVIDVAFRVSFYASYKKILTVA